MKKQSRDLNSLKINQSITLLQILIDENKQLTKKLNEIDAKLNTISHRNNTWFTSVLAMLGIVAAGFFALIPNDIPLDDHIYNLLHFLF